MAILDEVLGFDFVDFDPCQTQIKTAEGARRVLELIGRNLGISWDTSRPSDTPAPFKYPPMVTNVPLCHPFLNLGGLQPLTGFNHTDIAPKILG